MSLSRRYMLILVALMVILVNILDLTSTYYASPDLEHEWNILERHFGLGWMGLIAAKLIGGWLAVAGYAYYLRHRDACYPTMPMGFGAFCRYFSFGRTIGWLQATFSVPTGHRLGATLGYFWTGMQGIVLWVAMDNILVKHGFVFPLRYHSELAYHLLQSGIIALAVMARFYTGNYLRYRQQLNAGSAVEAVVSMPIAQTSLHTERLDSSTRPTRI